MPRDTVGYTPGAGALVETYPDATDGAVREATVITDPENRRAAYVTTDNRLQVKMDTSSTPVVTSVPISTTSVTLVAADATGGRTGVTLHNDTSQIAYVRKGVEAAVIAPTGTAGGFSFELAAGQVWESSRNYIHAVTCIWPSTTGGGAMRVTVE
jgi:hypothetical protein